MLSWVYPLRIVQALFALATIGLSAYGSFNHPNSLSTKRENENHLTAPSHRHPLRLMVLLQSELLYAFQRLLDHRRRSPLPGPRPTLVLAHLP